MMEKPIYVGESSFESMVEENAYLVDKTHYIKSIFKDGENTVTKSRFTKMWIDMINLTEKSKSDKS